MDEPRFDAITRFLTTTQPRRGTLRQALAGVVALALGAKADLAQARTRQNKKRKRRRKQRRNRCRGSLTRCFGSCVDTSSDRRHCGRCFKDCDDDETCLNGECVSAEGDRRCPVEVCQVGFRNNQGVCVYVNTPNNQTGPACMTSGRFCCNGDCCRQGDLCLTSGCCTPDPNPCQDRCGTFTDNCGQSHQCGACPPAICQTVTCNPQTHVCDHVDQPNLTSCTTANGQAGRCCAGACVAGAQCCGISDCPDQFPCRPNQCQDNQCVRIIEPDRTACAPGDNGLPGICCGGFCLGGAQCCATSDCPDETCREKLCSDNICQYRNLPNGQQGPNCTAQGQSCCGQDQIQPATCCSAGQTCSGVTCSGP